MSTNFDRPRAEVISDGMLRAQQRRHHVVVCCDISSIALPGAKSEEFLASIVAPQLRYNGVRLHAAESEPYQLFFGYGLECGTAHAANQAVLACLEVAARVRNFTTSNDWIGAPCMGIACEEGSGSAFESDAVESLIRRSQFASEAARGSEILSEDSLAFILDGELMASQIGLQSEHSETGLVSIHGIQRGRTRMVQARGASRRVIGRDTELALMQAAQDVALGGEGQVIGLCGPRGAGKTFMLAAIVDNWIERGGVGFISRCRPSTQKQPLWPVFSFLQLLAGLHGYEGEEERSARMLAALRELGCSEEQLEMLAPVVCQKHAENVPWNAIAACIGELVERQVRKVPLLLIFEDMQYADPSTLRFIAALSSAAGKGGALLLVTSYRAGKALGNLRRSLSQEIVLTRMGSAEMKEIARNQARVVEMCPNLVDYLVQHGGGNPGRMIELVGFFAQHGLIDQNEGLLSFVAGGVEQAQALAGERLSSGVPRGRVAALGTPAPMDLENEQGRARRPTSRTR